MREREREIERIDLGVSKRERDRWMEEVRGQRQEDVLLGDENEVCFPTVACR